MKFSSNTINLSNKKVLSQDEKSVYLLVGPPSVGKSTWLKSNLPDAFVISRDDIVDEVASEFGLTYDDLFANPDKNLQIGDKDEKFGTVIKKPHYLPSFLPDKVWDKVTNANGEVHKRLQNRIQEAKLSGGNIVVDMTNMNAKSRQGMLKNFKDLNGYKKKVVDFKFEGEEVQNAIKEIKNQRAREIAEQGGSKTIPDHVMDSMFGRYEPPSKGEGFDDMIDVDDRVRILDQAKRIRENQ